MFISINTNDHSRDAASFAADTLRELGLIREPSPARGQTRSPYGSESSGAWNTGIHGPRAHEKCAKLVRLLYGCHGAENVDGSKRTDTVLLSH